MNRATLALGLGVVVLVGAAAAGIVVFRKKLDAPSPELRDAYAEYSQCMFGGPLEGPSPCRRVAEIAWSLPEEQTDWPSRCDRLAARVQQIGAARKTKNVSALIRPRSRSDARNCVSSDDRAQKLDELLRGGNLAPEGVAAPSPILPRYTPPLQAMIDTRQYSVSNHPITGAPWGVTARHYDTESSHSTHVLYAYAGLGRVIQPPLAPSPPDTGTNPFLHPRPTTPFDGHVAEELWTGDGAVSFVRPTGRPQDPIVFWTNANGAVTRKLQLPHVVDFVARVFPNGVLLKSLDNRYSAMTFHAVPQITPIALGGDTRDFAEGESCNGERHGGILLDGKHGAQLVFTDGDTFSVQSVGAIRAGSRIAGCRNDRVIVVTAPPRRALSCGLRDCIPIGAFDGEVNVVEDATFTMIGDSLLEVRQGFAIRYRIASPKDLASAPFSVLGDAGGDGGGLRVTVASDPERRKAMLFLYYGPRTAPADRLGAVEIDEKGTLVPVPLAALPAVPAPSNGPRRAF